MTEQQLSIDDLCPRKRPIEDVHGLARFGDPQTSQDAAKVITGRTERRLLAAFGEYGQYTDDELAAHFPDMYPPTLKSARSRLTAKRLLVDSGTRRWSVRGCEMIVWRRA